MTRTSLIALLISTFLIVGCNNKKAPTPTPTPSPTEVTQEEINNVKTELQKLTGQATPTGNVAPTVPTKETILKPQSGYEATGYASHSYADNKYTLTVLADLPKNTANQTYQAWLLQSPLGSDTQPVKIGQLKIAKSGYMLDYSSTTDMTNYKYFVISQESDNDNQIQTPVLTGQVE